MYELKEQFNVRVYAYCLMTNHVHLLVSPDDTVSGLGKMMKGLAARATRYRNKLEGRSGTLWESRYKSSPVQSDQYLLACCRYIELNPVRAGMVTNPEAYAWSSYRQRMGIDENLWIDLDPCYLGLAKTENTRRKKYGQFVQENVTRDELSLIHQALQRGQLTGNHKFVDEVEHIVGKRIEIRGQGRPQKESISEK